MMCAKGCGLINIYDAEDTMATALVDAGVVDRNSIFVFDTLPKLKPSLFDGVDDDFAFAVALVYSGLKIISTTSNGKVVTAQPIWRTFVVTPDELYKDVAGAKIVEVAHALLGLDIDGGSSPLTLIDDAREFNEPDFTSNLFAIPMVFGYQTIITKGRD